MDNMDEFIDKIIKGQDTSYDDIDVSADINASATQVVYEDGGTWAYNYISENDLPKRKR